MVIETKYDYIYYTVLGVQEILELLREAGTIDEMMDIPTWSEREEIWTNSLNKVFKNNKDDTVNNFRVEEAMYCDDINYWYHRNIQHKDCPVFVQYNDSQPIKIEGEGHLFCLSEEPTEEEQAIMDSGWAHGPDDQYWDGLAGAGGRL